MPNRLEIEYLLKDKKIDPKKLKLLNEECGKIKESLAEKQELNRKKFPRISGRTLQESYDY